MKKWIIWSFERGSFQYDILCALILTCIFLIPSSWFNDRPDFMRVPNGEEIRLASDDNGNPVFTVKVDRFPLLSHRRDLEQAALDRLRESLDAPFTVARKEPIYDTAGVLVAYSFWITR